VVDVSIRHERLHTIPSPVSTGSRPLERNSTTTLDDNMRNASKYIPQGTSNALVFGNLICSTTQHVDVLP
jgi:hypothetical protein